MKEDTQSPKIGSNETTPPAAHPRKLQWDAPRLIDLDTVGLTEGTDNDNCNLDGGICGDDPDSAS